MRELIERILEGPAWICGNCRWFKKMCTRPDISLEDKQRLGDWPNVDDDDWCSVWENKQNVTAGNVGNLGI